MALSVTSVPYRPIIARFAVLTSALRFESSFTRALLLRAVVRHI